MANIKPKNVTCAAMVLVNHTHADIIAGDIYHIHFYYLWFEISAVCLQMNGSQLHSGTTEG